MNRSFVLLPVDLLPQSVRTSSISQCVSPARSLTWVSEIKDSSKGYRQELGQSSYASRCHRRENRKGYQLRAPGWPRIRYWAGGCKVITAGIDDFGRFPQC